MSVAVVQVEAYRQASAAKSNTFGLLLLASARSLCWCRQRSGSWTREARAAGAWKLGGRGNAVLVAVSLALVLALPAPAAASAGPVGPDPAPHAASSGPAVASPSSSGSVSSPAPQAQPSSSPRPQPAASSGSSPHSPASGTGTPVAPGGSSSAGLSPAQGSATPISSGRGTPGRTTRLDARQRIGHASATHHVRGRSTRRAARTHHAAAHSSPGLADLAVPFVIPHHLAWLRPLLAGSLGRLSHGDGLLLLLGALALVVLVLASSTMLRLLMRVMREGWR